MTIFAMILIMLISLALTAVATNADTDTCPVCLRFTDAPELQAALHGFDPFMADPNKTPDPGSRGQIFAPFTQLDDGHVHISPFIVKALSNQPCSTDFLATSHKNYNQYQESKIIWKTGAGDLHVPAMRYSDEEREVKIRKMFQETEAEILTVANECITQAVEVATFITPTFSQSFATAIRDLHHAAKNPSSTESVDTFIEFTRTYGTHYMKKTFLGTKIVLDKIFLTRSKNAAEDSCRKQCLRNAAHASVRNCKPDIVSIEAEFSKDSQRCATADISTCFRDDNNYFVKNGLVTEKVASFGRARSKNSESFTQDTVSSVPIAFELEPLSYLFSNLQFSVTSVNQEHLSSEFFDGNRTRHFFEDMRSHYCSLISGRNCVDVNRNGCGLNSLCGPQEICANSASDLLGYRCHQDCVAPYVEVAGVGCLLISSEKKTFTGARTACEQQGDTLLAFSTLETIISLATYMDANKVSSNQKASGYWVDISRGHDRVWSSVGGLVLSPVRGASPWNLVEPSGDGHCGGMLFSDAGYGVNDAPCSANAWYVCSATMQ